MVKDADACSLEYLSPQIPHRVCHRPFPSRCACDLLRFSETPPHLTTWTFPPHSTVGLQWVSLHRAWTVVGCCAILYRLMLWLNTCMSLLLPVAMAHINCKHTLCCMQKITQKNNSYVVFGYKHTLWDSQSCALVVLQMLYR